MNTNELKGGHLPQFYDNPIYKYKSFIIRVNDIIALQEKYGTGNSGNSIIFATKSKAFTVKYYNAKERNDNFELLSDMIK